MSVGQEPRAQMCEESDDDFVVLLRGFDKGCCTVYVRVVNRRLRLCESCDYAKLYVI